MTPSPYHSKSQYHSLKTSPDDASQLLLLDQVVRLTVRLIESVASTPLPYSQHQRLQRILTRLEASILEALSIAKGAR